MYWVAGTDRLDGSKLCLLTTWWPSLKSHKGKDEGQEIALTAMCRSLVETRTVVEYGTRTVLSVFFLLTYRQLFVSGKMGCGERNSHLEGLNL